MALKYEAVGIDPVNSLTQSAKKRAGSLSNAAWASLGSLSARPNRDEMPGGAGQPQAGSRDALWNENVITSQTPGGLARSLGFNDNVPSSLINSESGGNWNASNNEIGAGGIAGHDGILQFGDARLTDAKRAGVIPHFMSREQFRQDHAAQVAAGNWHFNDIDNHIRRNGYDQLIGQEIGGVPMSWNGMRAMAHLGGFGGLQKFINTSGSYNPSDSFGTSLSKYGIQHRG